MCRHSARDIRNLFCRRCFAQLINIICQYLYILAIIIFKKNCIKFGPFIILNIFKFKLEELCVVGVVYNLPSAIRVMCTLCH